MSDGIPNRKIRRLLRFDRQRAGHSMEYRNGRSEDCWGFTTKEQDVRWNTELEDQKTVEVWSPKSRTRSYWLDEGVNWWLRREYALLIVDDDASSGSISKRCLRNSASSCWISNKHCEQLKLRLINYASLYITYAFWFKHNLTITNSVWFLKCLLPAIR